jgi:adenine-specific DNA methylase
MARRPTLIISTDPPYYDNIGYADLSDFFYVWLRQSLAQVWPDLFRRLTTPKAEELVATPYRHGGKQQAESFFIQGMSEALTAMRNAATHGEPLAIYYAFKQSELAEDGITSPGWASFLQAVIEHDSKSRQCATCSEQLRHENGKGNIPARAGRTLRITCVAVSRPSSKRE